MPLVKKTTLGVRLKKTGGPKFNTNATITTNTIQNSKRFTHGFQANRVAASFTADFWILLLFCVRIIQVYINKSIIINNWVFIA